MLVVRKQCSGGRFTNRLQLTNTLQNVAYQYSLPRWYMSACHQSNCMKMCSECCYLIKPVDCCWYLFKVEITGQSSLAKTTFDKCPCTQTHTHTSLKICSHDLLYFSRTSIQLTLTVYTGRQNKISQIKTFLYTNDDPVSKLTAGTMSVNWTRSKISPLLKLFRIARKSVKSAFICIVIMLTVCRETLYHVP